MTILAATFALTTCEETNLPTWSGVLVREWLLKQLEAINPTLHKRVMSDEIKPYTVSALRGDGRSPYPAGTQLTFRVTSLQEDLTQWMEDVLIAQYPETMTLAKQGFLIESVTATTTTSTTLLDTSALQTGRLSRRIRVHFDSPTAFRRSGLSFSLPLPEWVFGHWLDKWNHFNSQKLHPDARTYAAECIAVNRHHLRSRFLKFDDTNYSPVSGTSGYVQFYMVKGDRYWQSLMHALAAYGEWAGSGMRTAVGMGQTRIGNP